MSPHDRDAILSRRARLVALSLAGAGLSLQPPAAAQAPAQAPAPTRPPASAQAAPSASVRPSAEDQAAARRLYAQAEDELLNGSPEAAIELLLRAARAYPHPKILARLFEALEQTNRLPDAAEVLDQLLARPDLDPALHAELKARAERLGELLATLILPAYQGTMTLDQRPVSQGRLRLLPGKYLLTFSQDGCATDLSLVLRPGQTREVSPAARHCVPVICLSPPPPPPPPPARSGCGCGNPGAGT